MALGLINRKISTVATIHRRARMGARDNFGFLQEIMLPPTHWRVASLEVHIAILGRRGRFVHRWAIGSRVTVNLNIAQSRMT